MVWGGRQMAFRRDHMSKGTEREKLSNYVKIAKIGICSQARTLYSAV